MIFVENEYPSCLEVQRTEIFVEKILSHLSRCAAPFERELSDFLQILGGSAAIGYLKTTKSLTKFVQE